MLGGSEGPPGPPGLPGPACPRRPGGSPALPISGEVGSIGDGETQMQYLDIIQNN